MAPLGLEGVPVLIVGGLDVHRKRLMFDCLDTATGEARRGQTAPADRVHLRSWLVGSGGRDDVAFALEGCGGWRCVAGELAAAGVAADVAGPAGAAFARGRKRHAKRGKAGSRHLRELLAEGGLPECRIAPPKILGCRAMLGAYRGLRAEHTAWVQCVHGVFFRRGAPGSGRAPHRARPRSGTGGGRLSLAAGRAAAGGHRAGGARRPGGPAGGAAAPAAARRPQPDRGEGAGQPALRGRPGRSSGPCPAALSWGQARSS